MRGRDGAADGVAGSAVNGSSSAERSAVGLWRRSRGLGGAATSWVDPGPARHDSNVDAQRRVKFPGGACLIVGGEMGGLI